MNQVPDATIVIPNYRPLSCLARLLESLKDQDLGKYQAEILVITHNDFLPEKVEKAYGCRVYKCEKMGANAARNQGIENAKGRFILLIDDDCVVARKDFVATWISFLESKPEIAAAGGRYSFSQNRYLDGAYNLMTQMWQECALRERPNLLGGHVIYRANVFEWQTFDPNYIYGGTESEFHKRILDDGMKLEIQKDIEVVHQPLLSFGEFLSKAQKQGLAKGVLQSRVPLRLQIVVIGRSLGRKEIWYHLPALMLYWVVVQWASWRVREKFSLIFSRSYRQ